MNMEESSTHIGTSHATVVASVGALGTTTTGNKRSMFRTNRVQKGIEVSIPKSSMLDGPNNYQVWSFRISNIMGRYDVWTYYINPASLLHERATTESEGRSLAMMALIKSVKDLLVTTVGRFQDPYVCWEYLKKKYAPKSGSRRLMLLRKLVSSRKEEMSTMEQYLKSCKETID
jgi:hypothetical protein